MENKNNLFNKKLIGEWLTQAIIEHSTRKYDKKSIRDLTMKNYKNIDLNDILQDEFAGLFITLAFEDIFEEATCLNIQKVIEECYFCNSLEDYINCLYSNILKLYPKK